jgi:DNA modification methylase
METNKIYQGDCLELMKEIKDNSIDMILCDLPYGTTAIACKNTKRNFIGMELSEDYVKIANERLTKLNEGNDSIPPKPKDLGILPTII